MLPRKHLILMTIAVLFPQTASIYLSSYSKFHGTSLGGPQKPPKLHERPKSSLGLSSLSMRKQKASDRRTRRLQRGGEKSTQEMIRENLRNTITSSPMEMVGVWNQKQGISPSLTMEKSGGRGRSRKRATIYNSLSSYHNKFFSLLTAEYHTEEQEVLGRIRASVDHPLSLEAAGHAVFDLYPERRGNLFSDEVYRLAKAKDATSVFVSVQEPGDPSRNNVDDRCCMPPNSKFCNNDVILLTLQPQGSGDFFDPNSLPLGPTATSIEARVISTGPSYIDIAVAGGTFEAAFGPAPNNVSPSGRGNVRLRLRADRFFSDVPYTRMVAALTQLTAVPHRRKEASSTDGFQDADNGKGEERGNPNSNICMDDLLAELIISSHAFTDPTSPFFHDVDAFDLQHLYKLVSKPPMPNSIILANQALSYIQNNPHNIFNPMNGPQLAAIGAALTRKLTMIQGPPGTGKTSTASAIGFGFTHQCRSISPNAKVLACAFSNVGADNLAESFLKVGLKVVRVGKASAVSEHLWGKTLDAAIDADPEAQKALQNAARATAQLAKLKQRRKTGVKTANDKSMLLSERTIKDIATAAVKQSIHACNKAASKALREADVIVSTLTGAADPRLLAACGLYRGMDEMIDDDSRLNTRKSNGTPKAVNNARINTHEGRTNAPDGLPPLSLPFVIIDEACQSIEPATLIPVTASNSCRSLVLLGDPCQLPATVKNDPESVLSISLMERLAATMPAPLVNTKTDVTQMDSSYLNDLPIKQAKSLMRSYGSDHNHLVYRKRFSGALLLGIQYRMHPSIAAFSSAVFYDRLLVTPVSLAAQRPFPTFLNDIMPCGNPDIGVRLIDVGGRCNEKRDGADKFRLTAVSETFHPVLDDSTTYSNEAEAVRVVALIREILKNSDLADPSTPMNIGVVTPYSGQVKMIKGMISADPDILAMLSQSPATVEVKSVDGYQGRERDVIIFSAVRSNRRGNVGFLTDWRRLNVALTRARQALLVIGDVDTLSEGDKHWAAFHKWCQGVRCVVDDTEYAFECDSL